MKRKEAKPEFLIRMRLLGQCQSENSYYNKIEKLGPKTSGKVFIDYLMHSWVLNGGYMASVDTFSYSFLNS